MSQYGRELEKLVAIKKQIAVVYRQAIFCNTRQEAFERVAKSGWLARLTFLFMPDAFFKTVDQVHTALIHRHDELLAKREQEAASTINIVQANGVFNGRSSR